MRPNRPGEIPSASGFLNRAVSAWYKQMRRIQSYRHAVFSSRAADNYHSRASLWHSILVAPGFQGGFQVWWRSRPVQHQGSPLDLPRLPPDQPVTQLIYEDFFQNFKHFEHWQLQRRRESCRHKLQSSSKGIYACVRKQSKPPLDYLVDSHSQVITVQDTAHNLVSVPLPFPESATAHWTLQGQPARVSKQGDLYQIDSDFLLASGQSLVCHEMVTSTEIIQDRLCRLWSPRWNRHAEVPSEAWDAVCQYAANTLPRGQVSLPAITIEEFRRATHAFKVHAATGPCGWSRSDLLHLTDSQVQTIIDGYHAIEQGLMWPKQWCVGLIHCLQKRDTSTTVDGYRPITVMSIFYRLFAGIRSAQILSQLSGQADAMQCGFMKGRQASDVWYFVGVCLELATCQNSTVFGLVADLVKAYNTLPRRPVFFCLELLGVPRWFLSSWWAHLQAFERFFVVRKCTSDPLVSVTGFPEGCPLACAAMTALDCLWHWAMRSQVPRVLPISFVDNLELVCDRSSDLLAASSAQSTLCALLDLELDIPRLYAWASTPAGRRELKANGFQVSLSERDLGGQVVYSRQLRNKILQDRVESVIPCFGKLRGAQLPVSAKMLNLKQVVWPRALHGIEAVSLGKAHINKLRTGAMRALKWNRAGASPLIRLGLLHHELDPAWYQMWRVIKLFRHQCLHNHTILDWWRTYSAHFTEVDTHGPFGKVQEQLHSIGLVLDSDGRLWFSENGYIHLFSSPESLVRQLLLHHFHNSVAVQVSGRSGFEDLDGFDYSLTTCVDSQYPPAAQEQLQIVRDGAFFTNHAICKFDASKTNLCAWCHQPDTREHRYTTCSRYDNVRARHQELFSFWDDLPASFRCYGLVSKNPWQLLLYEAFAALPDLTQRFEFMPTGNVWHVFTDGSCDNPTNLTEALASWSVVVAGSGPVSAGPLQGLLQTILRAEITAVWSALSWAASHAGDLHLWIDNLTVVTHLRELLQGTANFHEFEHADLWQKIHRLLHIMLPTVYVHKVASHLDPESSVGPVEDFARCWNDLADRQAKLANQQRPAFFQRVWQKFLDYRRLLLFWVFVLIRASLFWLLCRSLWEIDPSQMRKAFQSLFQIFRPVDLSLLYRSFSVHILAKTLGRTSLRAAGSVDGLPVCDIWYTLTSGK
eukprot:s3418_g6.t1